jgi:hypothetical protein
MVLRFINEVTSPLAAALFLIGFYLLYYSSERNKFLCIIPFTVAVFTKYTVLPPLGIILAYYMYLRLTDSSEREKIRSIMPVTLALVVISVSFILLMTIYPDFINYTFSGHGNLVKPSLLEAFDYIITERSLEMAAAALMFTVFAYAGLKRYFNKDDGVFLAAQLSLLFVTALFILAKNGIGIGTQYPLPTYPLTLAAIMMVLKSSKKLFTIIFISCFIFPSFFYSPFHDLTRVGYIRSNDNTKTLIEYGLHYIPSQDGLLLMEGPPEVLDILKDYDIPIHPSETYLINPGQKGFSGYEDSHWAKNLRIITDVDMNGSDAYEYLTDEEREISDMLVAEKFSAILMGPPAWATIGRVLRENIRMVSKEYCLIYIPNFLYEGRGGLQYSTLLLDDDEKCKIMKVAIVNYYGEKYDFLCELGERPYNVVDQAMKRNGILVKHPGCNNTNEYLFDTIKSHQLTLWDILLTLVLILPLTYLSERFG